MPREQQPIQQFGGGIISGTDLADVPPEAASVSVDVDNDLDDGKLTGRPGDESQPATFKGTRDGAYITNDDGTRDFIGLRRLADGSAELFAVKDHGGANTAQTALKAYAAPPPVTSAQPGVREVRFGLGGDVARPPQWVGYNKQKRIDGTEETGLIVADCELRPAATIPFIDRFVASVFGGATNYMVGFTFRGDRLYRFIAGAIDDLSDLGVFRDLRGICIDGANKLWLFDQASALGTLIKVNPTTFAIEDRITLSGYTIPAGYYVTDLVWCDDTLFFALNTAADPTGQYINLVFRIKDDGSVTVPTDCTPLATGITDGFYGKKRVHIDKPVTLAAAGDTGWTVLTTSANHGFMATGSLEVHTFSIGSTPVYNGTYAEGDWAIVSATQVKIHVATTLTGAPDPGSHLAAPADYRIATATNLSRIPAKCLIKLDATHIGWCVNLDVATDDVQTLYTDTSPLFFNNTTDETEINVPCFILTKTSVISDAHAVVKLGVADEALRMVSDQRSYNDIITVDTAKVWQETIDPLPAVGAYGATTPAEYLNPAAIVAVAVTDGVFICRSLTTGAPALYIALVLFFSGGSIRLTCADDTSVSTLDEDTAYFYWLSIEYDGTEDSPLTASPVVVRHATGTKYGVVVTVTADTIAALNKRMSAVKVWRAKASGENALEEQTMRYLVDRIPVDAARWDQQSDGSWIVTTSDRTDEALGQDYETATGMPEVLTSSMVHYGLSCYLNGYLFAASCYHADLPNASRMLFRSKNGRFDMFNWSEEYMILPAPPIAMAPWGGRLWLFLPDRIYRVNPETLNVEHVIHGKTALGPKSVLPLDRGLLHADKNGLYEIDGQNSAPIGEAIRTSDRVLSTYTGWLAIAHTNWKPVMFHLPVRNSVLIAVDDALSSVGFYVYHLDKKRWDYWTITSDEPENGFFGWTGLDRNGYAAFGDGAYSIASHDDSRKSWQYFTGAWSLGTPGIKKKYYIVRPTLESGTLTWYYSIDRGTTFVAPPLAAPFPYADSILFWFAGSGTTKVRGVNTVFRRMEGLR